MTSTSWDLGIILCIANCKGREFAFAISRLRLLWFPHSVHSCPGTSDTTSEAWSNWRINNLLLAAEDDQTSIDEFNSWHGFVNMCKITVHRSNVVYYIFQIKRLNNFRWSSCMLKLHAENTGPQDSGIINYRLVHNPNFAATKADDNLGIVLTQQISKW